VSPKIVKVFSDDTQILTAVIKKLKKGTYSVMCEVSEGQSVVRSQKSVARIR